MATITLHPKPLTRERFAPYGDVIARGEGRAGAMNEARFERHDDLAGIDVDTSGDAHVAVSIARSRTATSLPYQVPFMERHPLGSQAFVPLSPFVFIVVVAPPGPAFELEDLRAFVSNGAQGINYRRGTWHMPLIALEAGQDFLVIDRAGGGANCEERVLDEPVLVTAP